MDKEIYKEIYEETDKATDMKQRYTEIVSGLGDIVATESSAILNAFEVIVPEIYKKKYVKTKQPEQQVINTDYEW